MFSNLLQARKALLRPLCLGLCYSLILSSAPVTRIRTQQSVTAAPTPSVTLLPSPTPVLGGLRTTGAPSLNLPDLDQIRNKKEPEPAKAVPVSANRCRHWDQKCKDKKEKKTSQAPSSADPFRGLLAANTGTRAFDWRADAAFPLFDSAVAPHAESIKAAARLSARQRTEWAAFERRKARLPHAFASSLRPATTAATLQYANFETARVQPHNRTGQPGEDLFSGNYNWSVPIISLPGRAGHDFNLALTYNSLVWTKSGSAIRFDMDYGTPSPGFQLALPYFYGPYLNSRTNRTSYIVVTPGGAAIEVRQKTGTVYESEDGSYLQFKYDSTTGLYTLTTADGTQYIYGATLEIKDRNGNKIVVAYNADGAIDTITDTLGRVLTFNYGSFYELLSISQSGNGTQRTIASFSYTDLPLYYSFSGVTPDNVSYGQLIPVMYQVDLMGGTSYKFQYNSYGQVNKIERRAAQTFIRAWTQYNFQLTPTPSDCPRFTARTDWAYEWSAPAGVTTNYQFLQSVANPDAGTTEPSIPTLLCGQATVPDGTTHKEFYYPDPTGTAKWRYGLLKMAETWTDGNTITKKRTQLQYEQPCGGGTLNNWTYTCNPRVTESNIYDNTDSNNATWENRRRTTISYTASFAPTDFNLPADVYEYDSNATTVLRRTHTDYNQSSTYYNRRILGLPTMRLLYDGANTLYSKVQYVYDEAGSVSAHMAAPLNHDTTNYGTGFVAGRGNVTTTRRYDVNNGTSVANTTAYYLTGAVANVKDALNHQTTFSYDSPLFQNASLTNTFAYPSKVTDPDGFYSTVKYDYNNGLPALTTDPKGASVLRQYDVYDRLYQVTNQVNGAYTRYEFDVNQYFVKSYSTIEDGAGEFYSITVFDGHDRPRATVSEHPGSVGGYKGVYNVYDSMGRQSQQSNPTEIKSDWIPWGDDQVNGSNGGWRWSLQTYDWKGRPLVTTNQDGTTKSISYLGCGCAGGDVATVTDEGTVIIENNQQVAKKRQQKIERDVLGRIVKTQTLAWENGAVYSTATNTYNVRDQITQSSLIVGTNGASQTTTNQYDGHGRLWKSKSPIQTADTIYEYFDDDEVKKVTDARLAAVNYLYNLRGLVTDISYDLPPSNPVPTDPLYVAPAAPVHFTYDPNGNRETMTDGIGSVIYGYDMMSRMQSETRTITEITKTYSLNYLYNLAGQVKQVKFVSPAFPAENVTTDYQRDKAGQLIGITGAPYYTAGSTQYASQVKYRAFGALKTMAYGSSHNTNANYTSRLQLQSLDVKRSGDNVTIANKSYVYHNDGRLKYSSGAFYADFSRAYQYDHAGRLGEAWTGTQANAFLNGSPIGSGSVPYRQAFTYDVWGNRLTNTGNIWGNSVNETETYNAQTLRHDGWQYDNAGNVVNDSLSQLKYDAAGRNISVSQGTPTYGVALATQSMDGDGLVVRQDPNTNVPHFFVNSSVLGGKVIAEVIGVDAQPDYSKGERTNSYVYFGETRIATQYVYPANSLQSVVWQSIDPLSATKTSFYPYDTTVNYVEPDSQGIGVDLVDPAALPPPQADPEQPSYSGAPPNTVWNGNQPTYYVDGIQVTERYAINLLQNRAATLDPNYVHDTSSLIRAGILGHWERKVVSKPSTPSNPSPVTAPEGPQFVMGSFDITPNFVVDNIIGLRNGVGQQQVPEPLPDPTNLSLIAKRPPNPECDKLLARIFGGDGAVAAGSGYEPSTLAHSPGADRSRFDAHVFANMHLYANEQGTKPDKPVGVYAPKGGRLWIWENNVANYGVAINYKKLGNLENATLVISHVANSRPRIEGERWRIGDIGGVGGDVNDYFHSHLAIITLKKGRIDRKYSFSEVFCK